jgi:hypothetical protein
VRYQAALRPEELGFIRDSGAFGKGPGVARPLLELDPFFAAVCGSLGLRAFLRAVAFATTGTETEGQNASEGRPQPPPEAPGRSGG